MQSLLFHMNYFAAILQFVIILTEATRSHFPKKDIAAELPQSQFSWEDLPLDCRHHLFSMIHHPHDIAESSTISRSFRSDIVSAHEKRRVSSEIVRKRLDCPILIPASLADVFMGRTNLAPNEMDEDEIVLDNDKYKLSTSEGDYMLRRLLFSGTDGGFGYFEHTTTQRIKTLIYGRSIRQAYIIFATLSNRQGRCGFHVDVPVLLPSVFESRVSVKNIDEMGMMMDEVDLYDPVGDVVSGMFNFTDMVKDFKSALETTKESERLVSLRLKLISRLVMASMTAKSDETCVLSFSESVKSVFDPRAENNNAVTILKEFVESWKTVKSMRRFRVNEHDELKLKQFYNLACSFDYLKRRMPNVTSSVDGNVLSCDLNRPSTYSNTVSIDRVLTHPLFSNN